VSQAAAHLLSLLCERSPDAYGEIKRRVGSKKSAAPSPIPAERWEEYVRAQFAPPPPPAPDLPPAPPSPRFHRREEFLATRGRPQVFVPLGRCRQGHAPP
jgi:hypothetical protein